MRKFLFSLDRLLKLRRIERDVRQQQLSDLLRMEGELAGRRRQVAAERDAQIEELRAFNAGGNDIDIDASTSRRNYAVRLASTIGDIDIQRARLASNIEESRKALVRADQAVKSLEKLAEKKQAEFVFQQERLESRDLEEAWRASLARKRNGSAARDEA